MSRAPDWLLQWLSSGDAILLVIALIAGEAIVIALILKRRSLAIIQGLVPGLCLAGALYAALSGARIEWVGFWLTLSLPAHLFDLRQRWKAADRR
jgi:hypothetical protein